MLKETIITKEAPKAIGPYSQAIKVGNVVYTSEADFQFILKLEKCLIILRSKQGCHWRILRRLWKRREQAYSR